MSSVSLMELALGKRLDRMRDVCIFMYVCVYWSINIFVIHFFSLMFRMLLALTLGVKYELCVDG